MYLEPAKRVLQDSAALAGNGEIQKLQYRYGTSVIQISGNMGVITFKGTVDGTNWINLNCVNRTTGAVTATATAVGIYNVNVIGLKEFKAEITTHGGGANRISATGIFYPDVDGVYLTV